MKRMGNVLVAVAMMVGALGATGCTKAGDQAAQQDGAPVAEPAAQNDAPAADDAPAPADDTTAVMQASITRLPAPPAVRVEVPGVAPSAHHVWQRGYWRWDSAAVSYAWVPGYWEDTTVYAPYAPPAPQYEYVGYAPVDGYVFVPGYWRWGGSEYVWMYGHWCGRADAGSYYHWGWEHANGRWERRWDRWDGDRWARWDRDRGFDRGDGRFGFGRGEGWERGGRGYVGAQPTGMEHGQHVAAHPSAGQQGGQHLLGAPSHAPEVHATPVSHPVAASRAPEVHATPVSHPVAASRAPEVHATPVSHPVAASRAPEVHATPVSHPTAASGFRGISTDHRTIGHTGGVPVRRGHG